MADASHIVDPGQTAQRVVFRDIEIPDGAEADSDIPPRKLLILPRVIVDTPLEP